MQLTGLSGNPRNVAGRPLKFKTVEELKAKIDAYFSNCAETKRPLTITGLAVALDTSRETLMNYEEKEEFFDTVKSAKEIIHNFVEEYLFTGKNVAGAIFNLKNNYGWKEKSETDITSDGKALPVLVKFLNGKPDNN